MPAIRIATRKSPLALWQAEYVKQQLIKHHPDLTVELVSMVTQGDRILDAPLAKIGGKGLFIKELETGIQQGVADIAVHSMKDVPAELPPGFVLNVICERDDPRDAYVSNEYSRFAELPIGATVGTCSLRRQCTIRAARPDLNVENLRGNVNTRLQKLDDGQYDAIILAAAGLRRLGLEHRIAECLSEDFSLPAVGQGAVGIESRENDTETHALISKLQHTETQLRVTAERAMNAILGGGCQIPIGGHAVIEGDQLTLRGFVGYPDGREVVADQISGSKYDGQALGRTLGERLLANGAREMLDSL